MVSQHTYAVYLHTNAVEVLGDAIKPYLTESPEGTHLLCREIDTGGSFCEMTVVSTAAAGLPLQAEVMIPVAMIRLIISATGNETDFGFG